MTTAIRLYRTYILSTFVPLNTIRRLSALFVASSPGFEPGAFRLGGGPSILLRYEDIYEIL